MTPKWLMIYVINVKKIIIKCGLAHKWFAYNVLKSVMDAIKYIMNYKLITQNSSLNISKNKLIM